MKSVRTASLDIRFINAVRLSTWAIYKSIYIVGRRAIDGFSILRRSAKCTRRPNLKAARFGTSFMLEIA